MKQSLTSLLYTTGSVGLTVIDHLMSRVTVGRQHTFRKPSARNSQPGKESFLPLIGTLVRMQLEAAQVKISKTYPKCKEVIEKIRQSGLEGTKFEEVRRGTSIVTGANAGIGRATARNLALLGSTVVLACRDLRKAEDAIDEIKAALIKAGSKEEDLKLVPMKLELDDLRSVEEFCEEIARKIESNDLPMINLMILNAGILPLKKMKSKQGYEMTFAVNHLGHFFLTKCLMAKGTSVFEEKCRVVVVTSKGHVSGSVLTEKIDSEDEVMKKVVNGEKFSSLSTYASSKLCNVLFMQGLNQLSKDETNGVEITACAVHPGVVKSDIVKDNCCLHFSMTYLTGWFFMTQDQGAAASIYTSLMPDRSVSGNYFSLCTLAKHSRRTQGEKGEKARSLLWKISEDLCNTYVAQRTNV